MPPAAGTMVIVLDKERFRVHRYIVSTACHLHPGNAMVSFLIKLVLSPLLITVSTLTARRWGPAAGGLLVGLPLTSGPVSVFLAIEQGRDFAAAAAHSTLLGVMAVVVFCVTYAHASARTAWPMAAAVSLTFYFAGVALFSTVSFPFPVSVAVTLAFIYAGTRLIKPVNAPIPALPAPPWDLPFRILAATVIIIAITMLSPRLGPKLSGMLSTFPAFITVMSVFSHSLHGPLVARQFVRGVVVGSYSFAVFFLVVCLTVRSLNLLLAYLLAMFAATGLNFAIFKATVAKSAVPSQK